MFHVQLDDVWAGRFSPRLAGQLVGRLIHEPWSHYRAHRLGGDDDWQEWLGFDRDSNRQLTTVDALLFVAAVIQAKDTGKPPRRPEPMPRPASTANRPRTIADLFSPGEPTPE